MREKTMKFVSLAPYYSNATGHNLPYQQALSKTASACKMEFEVLLPPIQGFKDVGFKTKVAFKAHNYFGFLSGILKLFRSKSPPRFFFLESFSIKDLVALSVFQLFLRKKDKLALLFRRGYPCNYLKIFALKMVLGPLGLNKRIHFLTDSELIAKQFTRYQVAVLPIPHTQVTVGFSEGKEERIVCYWPGAPREAKGRKEIEALSKVLDPQRFKLVAAQKSNLENATLIADYLSENEYYAELASADVILLPYDPVVYREGTSGILVEAICMGKMPLVKEGSWLAYELKKFDLHELVIDWHPETVFSKIQCLLENSDVQVKLRRMQEVYSSFHNQENFACELAKAF